MTNSKGESKTKAFKFQFGNILSNTITIDDRYEDVDPDNDDSTTEEELLIGTDPYIFDTDGDGVGDKAEIFFNTDPLVKDGEYKFNIKKNMTL